MTSEERLEQMIEKMFAREATLKEALFTAGDAEYEYRVAYAEAYQNAEGSIQAREAQAILDCKHLLKARKRADAVKEIATAEMYNVRQALSARQSILKAEEKAF